MAKKEKKGENSLAQQIDKLKCEDFKLLRQSNRLKKKRRNNAKS